jgi:hypothetical protein
MEVKMKSKRFFITVFAAALALSFVATAFAAGNETFYPCASPNICAKVDTGMPEKSEAYPATLYLSASPDIRGKVDTSMPEKSEAFPATLYLGASPAIK